MAYNHTYDMKYTDNPYIDLLVHYTKIMAINSVIKNESEALDNETLQSRTESDKMISYKQGYPIDKSYNIENYEELNNYYRRLAGLPPFPTTEAINSFKNDFGDTLDVSLLYISKYVSMTPYQDMVDKDILDLSPIKVKNNNKKNPDDDDYIYVDKYLHQFSDNEANVIILENTGILDQIKEDYKGYDDYKYIYYIGEKSIDPYIARTAENFSLLYVPMIPFEDIYNKYKRYFERNRDYTMSVIYSEAYKYGSVHYDNFIMILIIIQTMIDIISEVQEYIINKDVFDARTIKYLFDSYGVDYYKEIPERYQLAMIKNINRLIKYKSTNQNIVDICSLFGFPDIEVFSYYLLKVKKKPLKDFSFYTSNDVGQRNEVTGELITEDMVGTEKFQDNYELKFLRVPISDPNVSNYIDDKSLRRSYDNITNQDPFWDGISKSDILSKEDKGFYHLQKKNEILKQDFTCERTKYLSIDAAIDITKMSYQLTYFMNILYDRHIDEENLLVQVDSGMFNTNKSESVKLNDLLSLGVALGYLYNDIEPDIIATDMEKNMTINGFNFDTDWTDIYNSLNNNVYVRDFNGNKANYNKWGYLAEINSDYPGAFLSGRYKKCTCGTLEYDDPIVPDIKLNDKDTKEKKYTGTNPMLYSNGYICSWIVYHGLGTKNCVANVITATSLELVSVDIEFIDNNSCKVIFANSKNILAGSYYITILSSEEINSSDKSLRYSETNPRLTSINSRCIWTVNHNMNLTDYIYSVVDNTNNELVNVDMAIINNNSCQIIFDSNSDIVANMYTLTLIKSDTSKETSEREHNPIYESIIWEEMNNHRVYDSFECYDEYIYDGIDGLDYPKYLEDYIETHDVTCIKQSIIKNPIIHSNGEKCIWDVQHGLHTIRCITNIKDNNNETVIADIAYLNKHVCRITFDSVDDIPENTLTLTILGIYLEDDKMGIENDTGFAYHEIDITWDTPYDPEQNSHGNFINSSEISEILDVIDDTKDDLERYNKLKEIYTTNTNLYNHLVYMMNHAESKRMYDIYNIVFESFMETKFSTDFYDIKDSNGNSIYYIDNKSELWYYDAGENHYTNDEHDETYPATLDDNGNHIPVSSNLRKLTAENYYDFFKFRDLRLYSILIKASKGFTNKDEQKSYISKICDYILYGLNKYFNSTRWKYIYNIIPTHNLEFIQKCILKVINFFKSWKTQMLEQNVDYIFNDPYHNKIRILDDIMIAGKYDVYEKPSPKCFYETTNIVSYRDKVSPIDYVDFSYKYD